MFVYIAQNWRGKPLVSHKVIIQLIAATSTDKGLAPLKVQPSYSMDEDILRKLEERLGPLHARQRLGIETDHEAQAFGQGLTLFHLENLYLAPTIIRNALKLTGLYWRARRNAQRIIVKRNDVRFAALPPLFDGYTILHISDMHEDMNEAAMQHLIEIVDGMQYHLWFYPAIIEERLLDRSTRPWRVWQKCELI